MHKGKCPRWLLIMILFPAIITGCDKRGTYERAVDNEIAKIENDPHMSQADKDSTILLENGLKAQARDMDERIAAMTPAERDTFERVKRMQDQADKDQQAPR